jgi:glycosyltransferase involved in cell wall biosynthesis
MIYGLFLLKRMIEDLLIYPFILAGRRKAEEDPLQNNYDIFFFFPFYHTGGAEKVHAQIAMALRARRGLIIFTRKSENEGFMQAFRASGHDVLDISSRTDNKSRYWDNLVWRGFISQQINQQFRPPLIFNGQCNFGYKCAPWIRREITQIELIHSFNSFSRIRIPFIPFYSKTVMISRKAISDHMAQYRSLGIGKKRQERITYICNGVEIPGDAGEKDFEAQELRVLYAGRGTAEKRVHLTEDIAEACRAAGLPVRFTMMGDVEAGLRRKVPGSLQLLGNLTDTGEIDRAYRDADILILTSSEEGFPMVVMEAMARGLIILATPVGDLPAHIRDSESGFLFSSSVSEDTIRQEGVTFITRLLSDRDLCRRISVHNREYARLHFSLERFEESYRNLLPQKLSA